MGDVSVVTVLRGMERQLIGTRVDRFAVWEREIADCTSCSTGVAGRLVDDAERADVYLRPEGEDVCVEDETAIRVLLGVQGLSKFLIGTAAEPWLRGPVGGGAGILDMCTRTTSLEMYRRQSR